MYDISAFIGFSHFYFGFFSVKHFSLRWFYFFKCSLKLTASGRFSCCIDKRGNPWRKYDYLFIPIVIRFICSYFIGDGWLESIEMHLPYAGSLAFRTADINNNCNNDNKEEAKNKTIALWLCSKCRLLLFNEFIRNARFSLPFSPTATRFPHNVWLWIGFFLSLLLFASFHFIPLFLFLFLYISIASFIYVVLQFEEFFYSIKSHRKKALLLCKQATVSCFIIHLISYHYFSYHSLSLTSSLSISLFFTAHFVSFHFALSLFHWCICVVLICCLIFLLPGYHHSMYWHVLIL